MCIYKTLLNLIVMVSLMLSGLQVYATSISEDAIETESLRITMKADGTGYIQGKMCDQCKMLTVPVTAQTKAFDKNIEVPLQQAAGRVGKPATIFIDMDHTRVTRIAW
jgi:hypothetical protein